MSAETEATPGAAVDVPPAAGGDDAPPPVAADAPPSTETAPASDAAPAAPAADAPADAPAAPAADATAPAADAAAPPAAAADADVKWVYLDDSGAQQGPYNASEINDWYNGGYMGADRQVKKEGAEGDFVALSNVPELCKAPAPVVRPTAPTPPPSPSSPLHASPPAPFHPASTPRAPCEHGRT
jgi:pyruvate dehydrogenase E2 component (dihydrolipoamide acetyltransferase)